jgi:PAS domain S-box-containing protein
MKYRLSTDNILVATIALLVYLIIVIIINDDNQSDKFSKEYNNHRLFLQSRDVLHQSEKIGSLLQLNDVYLKIFVQTGDKNYSIPLLNSYNEIDQLLQKISPKNPAQEQMIDLLTRHIVKRRIFIKNILNEYEVNGQAAAVQLLQEMANADSLGKAFKRIQQKEFAALQKEEANTYFLSPNTMLTLAITSIFLLLIVFLQKVRVEIIEKRKHTGALKILNDQLEEKVSARTGELKKSNTLLFETFERISDSFIALDKNWCLTYMNAKACEIFECRSEEMIGKNIWTALKGKISQTSQAGYHQAMLTQKYNYIEEYNPVLNHWFENHLYPSAEGLSVFFRNITDKKNAEQALEESEKRYQTLTEASPVGVFHTNADGFTTYVNPRWCSITGVARKQALGNEWLNSVYPDDKKALLTGWKNATQTRESSTSEYRFIRPDGTSIWVLGQANPIINKQNQVVGYVGTTTDISERKKAEEFISQSNERYRSLLNSLEAGVVVHAPDTSILNANPKALELLGLCEDQLKGKLAIDTNWSFFDEHKTSLPAAAYPVNVIASTGKKLKNVVLGVYRPLTKDTRWLIVNGFPVFDSNNKIIEIVISFINTTDSKLAQEQMNKSNERFELISQATHDGLWDWNLQTNQIWANEMHQRLYGLTSHDPVPTFAEWKQRIHPEDRERTVNALEEAKLLGKDSYTDEYRFNSENNGWIFIYGRTLIKRNSQGEPVRLIGSMIDITDSKKVEQQLKYSEERLRLSLEASNQGLYDLNLQTGKAIVNAQYALMLGYEPAIFEESNEAWIERLHPEDKAPSSRAFRDYLEGKTKKYVIEFRQRTKSNGWKWILSHGKIVEFDPAGHPLRMLGTHSDITERKIAEQALQESEEKYRTLVEQAADAIVIADESGRLVTVNSSACKMTQYTEEELLEKTIYDFITEEDINNNPFHLKELKEGKTILTERVMKIKDGSLLYIEVNSRLLSDGRLLTFVRDISERKRNLKALAESENMLRTIYNTEPECINIINSLGTLMEINPAGLAMLEAGSLEEAKDIFIPQIINEPFRKDFQQLIKKIFKGESGTLEFKITGLQGTARWMETHAVPMRDTMGAIISFLGVTRDITNRKKAEGEIKKTTKQLRQLTAHLQSIREEERKRIGREIHDELGQQLTAIKMDVVWIDKKTPDTETTIKNKLNNIIGLLDGSNQSVRRILSELRPDILNDYGLVEALESQGKQFTASCGIPVFFINTSPDVKFSEKVSTCIFRVYQEALTNIMRYAQAKNVKTFLSVTNENIIFTVEDDGIGFDIKSVNNFKSFGILGMKERLLSMNGMFKITSSALQGTKISIILPLSS